MLLALGLVGLLLPFLPGFLFLFFAAACFAAVFPQIKRHLSHHPRMLRFFRRIDAGENLDITTQFKLAFWASLEAINPRRTTNWQNRNNHP